MQNQFNFFEDPCIRTSGFQLSSSEEMFIKKELELLKDQVPTGSFIKLKLDKTDQVLKGTLSIKNFTFHFHTNQKASNISKLIKLLRNQINEQILDWKRTRFSNSLLKHLSGNYCA